MHQNLILEKHRLFAVLEVIHGNELVTAHYTPRVDVGPLRLVLIHRLVEDVGIALWD